MSEKNNIPNRISIAFEYIKNNFNFQKTIDELKLGPTSLVEALDDDESQKLIGMFKKAEKGYLRSRRKEYIDFLFVALTFKGKRQKGEMSQTEAARFLLEALGFKEGIQVASFNSVNNFSQSNIYSELTPDELNDSRIAENETKS